ncbi:conserved hypothetical protein [Planktothrix sp. PCC 11201]|uniref:Uncharacterized protein n=1 Tax=Planktothrix serta PCC 8927 TaxID=671068 RepID=A0A7Z9BQD3_9CYAN|nr:MULTISPECIES: hypothetical protein [Planktothrix]SKB14233.1 conserved hypothetical protein [Planktothrix sp. PCC 11201]VXD14927.1 conserved hypothetical protein [Planktothrix serta PCC 8927]
MNETPFLPDPQQVKRTLAKAHRACQDMELAGLELQEVIEMLERNIREQRLKRLKQVS